MKNKRFIYALKCPFTNEVHYIGKTTQGMIRPLSHLKKSHNEKINEWVFELSKIGYKPIVEILENVDEKESLDAKELFYIHKFLNEGHYLLNSSLVSVALLLSKEDKSINEELSIFDISDISNTIKQKRKITGLSQEEFANKIGVALTVVRKIEQGKTNIGLDGLITILSMLNLKLSLKFYKNPL